jgi:predicted outer membrane repeat protein
VKIVKKQTILILVTFLFAIAIAGTGYAPPPPPDNVYVSPDGDDSGQGTDTDPFKTISVGIENVGDSGTVHLTAGTFDAYDGNANKDYDINIDKDLTIQGAGKEQTFIDANSMERIFRIADGYTVTIKDLTLMNGDASKGGAIKVRPGATLNVINCNFMDNTAEDGGAIYNFGTVTVTNCLFDGNTAEVYDSGGAIYSTFGSTLTVTGSTFTSNSAEVAGGIFLTTGIFNIIGNNFLNNDGNAIVIEPLLGSGAAGSPVWNINVNRIVGNTPYGLYIMSRNNRALAAASDGIFYVIDATNNWWGSNNDPRTQPGTIYDPDNIVDTTKWLVLKISANPSTVPFGSTSAVTASVIYNNLGEDTSSIGHIPDGTPITITTDIGNVGSKSITLYTAGGIVHAILRANDGLGIAHIYAILDGFMTPLPAQVVVTAAGTVGTTVGMQETGTPLIPIVLAILMVLGGMFSVRKK